MAKNNRKKKVDITWIPEEDLEIGFTCQWYNKSTKKNFTIQEIKDFQKRLIDQEN